MATALDEAKRQRELTKESLSRNIDLFESRVRHELDWKARLKRDGARYAVYGTVALAGLAGLFMLRRAVSHGDEEVEELPVEDIATELANLRLAIAGLEKNRKKENTPVWQKVALRAVTTAATAAGTAAAKKFFQPGDDSEHSSYH